MTEKKHYKLKGHGTFVVREGWISKALFYIKNDNLIFREKRAADVLGVGANMGQAIRYWLKACELMKETTSYGAKLTKIGELIYKHDPYLEDIFSIWILHCNLVRNIELATSWNLFFNNCEADEHTKEEIVMQMERELELLINSNEYPESSLKDDVTAICNMYSRVKEENYDPEDNVVSPFSELGLIKCTNNKYSKVQPNLKILDDKIVLYCLFKQMNNKKSISIDKIISDNNSVCKILNLSRVAVNQYLDRLEELDYIRINRTAGIDVVYRNEERTADLEYLESYYLS